MNINISKGKLIVMKEPGGSGKITRAELALECFLDSGKKSDCSNFLKQPKGLAGG